MTLSPERLAQWKELAERATPGPWQSNGSEINRAWPDAEWIGETCIPNDHRKSHSNAAFIAEARTAVPALVAEVERQRAQIQRLQDHPGALLDDHELCEREALTLRAHLTAAIQRCYCGSTGPTTCANCQKSLALLHDESELA